MNFEPKSKVYIQTDADGRILRCEGGYTAPADLTGWTEIDEGNGDKYNLCQTHYFEDGLYTSDGIPRYRWNGKEAVLRSKEELEEERQPTIEQLASEVRVQRDKLLLETDWTQVLDAPIDTDTREAYRAYRQALRDIPEQEGFPHSVVWPELPAKVKADPDPVDEAIDLLLSGATGEEVVE